MHILPPNRLAAVLLAITFPLLAEVRLPSLFSNHLVLQQNQPIAIWGWAEPGEDITITLNQRQTACRADADGKWITRLPAEKAGGPFELTVEGKNTIVLEDVMVGEVWLCSGQSNMAMSVQECLNFPQEREEAAAFGHVRQFKVLHRPSPVPQLDCEGNWVPAAPETVDAFTATGYFFAKTVSEKLPGVAIGLINASWGGTRIEPWTPISGLERIPALQSIHEDVLRRSPGTRLYEEGIRAYLRKLEAWSQDAKLSLADSHSVEPPPVLPQKYHPLTSKNHPTTLFNGMIRPLIPYNIRGVLWYQGEANLRDGMLYYSKMKALLLSWRDLWMDRHLPFYFVQLPPYQYGDPNDEPELLGEMWNAQAACENLQDIGMAVINDVGDVKDIHPKNKQEVGRRLALLALAKTYGFLEIQCHGPRFRHMDKDGDTLKIQFDYADGLTTRDGEAPSCFEIAGPEADYTPANAVIQDNMVILSHPDVKAPTAMRFAWRKTAVPNLTNAAGLSCSPFQAGDEPMIDFLKLHVPDSKQLDMIYDLHIASHGNQVIYSTDYSKKLVGRPFDRVAYFLELHPKFDRPRFVYVAMDAFTQDLSKIGVPTVSSGASFQMKVDHLTVISNHPGVTAAENLQDAGCIEFFPNNYREVNGIGIPDAKDNAFDFGDSIQPNEDGYGSMQVHNYAAKQTVFAYNNWRKGEDCDLGIGNSHPIPNHPRTEKVTDWTYNANGANYTSKRLRIFVHFTE